MKAPPTRSRNDPRRDATRTALIEMAEAMFAASGINGVSLRQIGAAIGSANANVVGYHFGDKEALIEAILLKHRLPVEEARAQLWKQAVAQEHEDDLLTLLDVLWRPLLEKKNAEGLHTYAAFLGSMSRSSLYALRLALNDRFAVTQDLVGKLAKLLPHLPDRLFRGRLHALSDLITGVLQRIDFDRDDDATAELLYRDTLRMAQALLTATVGDDELNGHLLDREAGSIMFI